MCVNGDEITVTPLSLSLECVTVRVHWIIGSVTEFFPFLVLDSSEGKHRTGRDLTQEGREKSQSHGVSENKK